jgi:hypothetical protein
MSQFKFKLEWKWPDTFSLSAMEDTHPAMTDDAHFDVTITSHSNMIFSICCGKVQGDGLASKQVDGQFYLANTNPRYITLRYDQHQAHLCACPCHDDDHNCNNCGNQCGSNILGHLCNTCGDSCQGHDCVNCESQCCRTAEDHVCDVCGQYCQGYYDYGIDNDVDDYDAFSD